MAEVTLNVETRSDTGKGAARRARAQGKVPGIVYGRGIEPIPVTVDRRDLAIALNSDAGLNALLQLQLDGQTIPTLAKELQRDPVKGTLLHVDLVKVDLTQEVEVEVPVHLVGDAPGVKEGGALEQPMFTVTVRSLPTEVPDSIDADISALNIGESLRVGDLAEGRTFHIVADPETVVASIAAPISEEELAAMEAEAGVAPSEGEEPEIVGDEAAEDAEGDAQAQEGGPGGAEQPSEE